MRSSQLKNDEMQFTIQDAKIKMTQVRKEKVDIGGKKYIITSDDNYLERFIRRIGVRPSQLTDMFL